jgi:hypothetical protein
MPSFLSGEAEKLHGIMEKTPALATAFEEKLIASSKRYIESLWKSKMEMMGNEIRKYYLENPINLGLDLLVTVAYRGYDFEHPQKEGVNSAKDYLKKRNLYVESTLQDAVQLIDFLDYEDLVEYLRFFTRNRIDSSVAYGKSMAKDSHKKHKTRMDGTLIPEYFLTVKVERVSKDEVELAKDTDVKEDKKEQGKSQRPRNVF